MADVADLVARRLAKLDEHDRREVFNTTPWSGPGDHEWPCRCWVRLRDLECIESEAWRLPIDSNCVIATVAAAYPDGELEVQRVLVWMDWRQPRPVGAFSAMVWAFGMAPDRYIELTPASIAALSGPDISEARA